MHISSQVTEPHLVFHIFKKPMIKAAVAQDPLTRPDASSVFHPKKTPTHLDRCRERGDSLIRWGGITQSSICSTAWQTHIKAVKVAPGLAGPSSTDQGSPSDQRGFQFPLSSFFCQIEPGQGVCECELAASSDLTIQSPHPGGGNTCAITSNDNHTQENGRFERGERLMDQLDLEGGSFGEVMEMLCCGWRCGSLNAC